MPFGDVTKFRTKSCEREENAWVLGWDVKCCKEVLEADQKLTAKMKAAVDYFPVAMFTTLARTVKSSELADEITNEMKATEKYFPLVLFTLLYKVALNFA